MDLKKRVVRRQGHQGELAAYSFIHTSNGRIRFRPEWPESGYPAF